MRASERARRPRSPLGRGADSGSGADPPFDAATIALFAFLFLLRSVRAISLHFFSAAAEFLLIAIIEWRHRSSKRERALSLAGASRLGQSQRANVNFEFVRRQTASETCERPPPAAGHGPWAAGDQQATVSTEFRWCAPRKVLV